MTTFREAIEAKDMDVVASMLAEDVVFTSPGRVQAFKVMVRPLRAAEALAARMGEQFEEIKATAVKG